MQIKLTFTFTDSDRALEVLSLFHLDPTVDLTNISIGGLDPRPKVAAADPLARPFTDHRDQRQAIEAAYKAEEAAIEAMTGFPAKIADRPEDRAAVRAKTQARNAELVKVRNERHQVRMREVDEARRLKCPTCNAEPDQRCLKASGADYDYGFAHAARIRKSRGY